MTGDRREFSSAATALRRRSGLPVDVLACPDKVGPGVDPCAAIQGDARCWPDYKQPLRSPSPWDAAGTLADARRSGDTYRDTVKRSAAAFRRPSRSSGIAHSRRSTIETPDASVNFLINGGCCTRCSLRESGAASAFYQSGGAFGFRDQLQDAMALSCIPQPRCNLRASDPACAAAGSSAKATSKTWWHPPPCGAAYACASPMTFLWLPFAVCRYVRRRRHGRPR